MSYEGNARVIAGLASKHFPKSLKSSSVLVAATHSGILFGLLGMFNSQKLPVEKKTDGYLKINADRMKYTDGFEFELHVAGIYPALGTLQNGIEEVQFITPEHDPGLFGAFKSPQTHFHKDITIPKSEIQKATNRLTQEGVVERYLKAHTRGNAETLHSMIWQNTDQTETTLAGLPFIVSETNNTYYLDRSLEKNSYWRPQRVSAVGAFNSLDSFAEIQTLVTTGGGTGDLIVVGPDLFTWSRRRLEETGNLASYHGEIKFGGSTLMYGDSYICLDPKVDDDSAGNKKAYCLSTEHFIIYSTDSEDTSKIAEAPYLNNAVHGKTDFYLGMVCEKCNAQGLAYGITAPA
jgi:hypothetical protein